MNAVSGFVRKGNTEERRIRLYAAACAEVRRLEEAVKKGWDVEEDLARARKYKDAFASSKEG